MTEVPLHASVPLPNVVRWETPTRVLFGRHITISKGIGLIEYLYSKPEGLRVIHLETRVICCLHRLRTTSAMGPLFTTLHNGSAEP